jgi:hypothetical protein
LYSAEEEFSSYRSPLSVNIQCTLTNSLFSDSKLSRSYTHSLICYTSYALGVVLINCFIFSIIHFVFVFLFCTFCLLFCVFCVFVLFYILFLSIYIVVYCLFLYNFTDHCHRVVTQLQLINIISYVDCLVLIRFRLGTTCISSYAPPA